MPATLPTNFVMVWTYAAYLTVSLGLTLWVARTLRKSGRVFVLSRLHGNEPLADSLLHLLVVGFNLVNFGYISLALKASISAHDPQAAVELLSTKIGYVLVVLGVMHFAMIAILAAVRGQDLPPRRQQEQPAQ